MSPENGIRLRAFRPSGGDVEYHGQARIVLDVRPKRAGFLVHPRRRESVRQAVLRASTRWGGLQEPIVPVTPTGGMKPFWREVLDVAEPDVLYDVANLTPAARQKIQTSTGLDVRDVSEELRRDSGMHPVGVLLHPDFRARAYVRPRSDVLLDLVALGDLAPWADESTWSDAQATFSVASSADDVLAAQFNRTSLIEATVTDLSESSGALLGGPPTLWLVRDPVPLLHLLFFWNARALQVRAFGYLSDLIAAESVLANTELADYIRTAFSSRQKYSTPDINILGLQHEIPGLAGIRRRLGIRAHPRGAQVSRHIGGVRETSDITASLNLHPFNGRLHGHRRVSRGTTTIVALTSPTTTIRAPSPVRFAPQAGGHVRLGLSGEPFQVPPRPRVATLFHDNAAWCQGRLELEVNPHQTYEVQLRSPEPRSVVLASIPPEFTIELSNPGRLAEGVIGRASGTVPTAMDPVGVAVIEALTTPRSRRSTVSIDPIPSTRQVERSLHSIASRAGLPRPIAGSTIGQLVDGGLIIRGLLIGCNTCGIESFVGLDNAAPPPRCPGCQAQARFKEEAGEPELHYRLNTLVDRASDQGVLPHLFAWSRLPPSSQAGAILGANIRLENELIGEVDLLATRNGQLLMGEAKRTAAWFRPDQIERDLRLAGILQADVYQLISLEPVPTQTRDCAAELAKQAGIRLEVVAPDGPAT